MSKKTNKNDIIMSVILRGSPEIKRYIMRSTAPSTDNQTTTIQENKNTQEHVEELEK